MSDAAQNEIKAIGNLLTRTAEIAEQATLTGVFEDGARRCAQQYNASVARLETLEAIPQGFFLPLADTAGFGEAGIACAQLAAYIGATSAESNATGGVRYAVLNAPQGGLSKEEQQELKDIREILRKLTAKTEENDAGG